MSLQIIERGEELTLPDGSKVPRPLLIHYQHARALLRKQEALFSELQRLPNSEQGAGRAASIKRQVAKMETKKHPALQEWNRHLFPREYRILMG